MTSNRWQCSHTIFGILLLICLISVFKNPFIYFEDYAKAFGLTNIEYSIILLWLYTGNITSLFFGVYVNNLFAEKYQQIASVFSFVSGLLSLLFCLITYFHATNTSNISSIFIVLYGSIIAFLYKNSASICYTTVVGLANEWSAPHRKGMNISYLQLSWSISTLLYIPIGFMLQYAFWSLPFIIFGAALILYAFVINWGYTFQTASETENMAISDIASNFSKLSQDISADIADLKKVFNKKVNLILLSIFFCSIGQGSFLIITSSFWMEDVYNLDTSSVGLVTLSIFFAEVIGSVVMAQISDYWGIFVCSFIAFLIEIIASLVILNLSAMIGPSIGGLWVAIFLNFFLFVGWEMFFISQVIAMVEIGPQDVSKNIVLLSNFAVASIAKMIGAELSTNLWNNGDGLQILSGIWLIVNILAMACYAILYQIKDKPERSEYVPISDGDVDQSSPML